MPVWHTDPCYKGASAVRMKAKRTASGRKRIFIFQTPPPPPSSSWESKTQKYVRKKKQRKKKKQLSGGGRRQMADENPQREYLWS